MSKDIVLTGLTELYSDRRGTVGQRVVVVLGKDWDELTGTQHAGVISDVGTSYTEVKFDKPFSKFSFEHDHLKVGYGSSTRSRIYVLPPSQQPQPEVPDTFFAAACRFDAAAATLKALKPGYDAAYAEYCAAMGALNKARHELHDIIFVPPKPVKAKRAPVVPEFDDED